MPELPEVQTITTDIQNLLKDAVIRKVNFVGTYQVYPTNQEFVKALENQKISKILRIAKNIIFELNNENYLLTHLAMTGKLLVRSPSYARDGWERVLYQIQLKNGKEIELRFCDTRMFGKVQLLNSAEFEALKLKYGPEPIDPKLTHQQFHRIVNSKKTNIKNLLLDQGTVAGLGNAYATDALWIAGIHPETPTQSITLQKAADLLEACREILHEGIKNRGLTIDSYVDAFGKPGQQQLFFRIYQQTTCKRCNIPAQFKKLNGRGTYFCENCQLKEFKQQALL